MRKLAFVSIILVYSLNVSAQLFEISFEPIFKNENGELIPLALSCNIENSKEFFVKCED